MITKLARIPAIYLVGFMGCGKTTIGRLLAEKLGWTFADIDADIEAEQEASIEEIFQQRGEEDFRELETRAIHQRVRRIQSGEPMVVALGGGAFAQPANLELVNNNGVTVWLDCPVDILWGRVEQAANRPLARDRQGFEQLYDQRRQAYARADFRIEPPDENPAAAVAAVLALPLF